MHRVVMSAVSAVVLLASSSASASELHSEVVALEKSFARAFSARDAKALADLYADRAVLIGAVEGDEHRGKQQIQKSFSELFKHLNSTVVHASTEVWPLSDKHAAIASHWIQTMVLPDGKKQEVKVRSTAVLEKQGGKWKYLVDHVSVGLPPPPAPKEPPTTTKR